MSRAASATIEAVRAAVRASLERVGVRCTDAVVVACSGGADSSVLADVVFELAAHAEIGPVTLVYVDHQLRPNTAADAAVVEGLAQDGGADFRCIRVEVNRDQASLEDAARNARYEALDLAAESAGAAFILTAHTASDQAETVLLRILRGSGVTGLAAIPERRGRLVRPLLEVPRDRIEAYRVARDLAAIYDPTNADLGFARNRVRGDLMPRLREENPRIEEALCRLAAAAREQRAALDYAGALLLARAASSDGRLDTEAMRAAPSAVVKRALAIACASVGCESLEARHLEGLYALISRPARGSCQIDLPGIVAVREYDDLVLRRADLPHTHAAPRLKVEGPEPPYEVRPWRVGDRMRPQRLKGRSKKLSDLFAEAKIPRDARPLALVVARADGAIEWAEHLGPAWQSRVSVTVV